ncbi:MAG: hypothetical protein IPJ65_09025 [Archangiaceae bacterium]|nr:hypothetical protein [Archangiaceae bacterium]
MRTLLTCVLAVTCGCASSSRAVALREQYRKNAVTPQKAQACLRQPETCPGYGETHWQMPLQTVQQLTGCTPQADGCVKGDERYVFEGDGLSAVVIDYRDYAAGRAALTGRFGAPGWEGDHSALFDDRVAEADARERAARVMALALVPFTSLSVFWLLRAERAHEDARELRAQKRSAPHLTCASWNRELTRVLLCEERGKGTSALFSSRGAPEVATPTGDWKER